MNDLELLITRVVSNFIYYWIDILLYILVFQTGGFNMAVRIGHARIDENGNTRGGKAGDNNGKEVMISNWYLHKKGWVVLRAKDAATAEKIAKCMEDACANNCIGYNQSRRLTLYNAVKGNGFKCDKANLKTKVETDCSALVRVCLAYAGINVSNFTTPNEKKIILATGLFEEISKAAKNSAYLRRGDILVTKTQGHTVVVLTNGSKAAAAAPTITLTLGERPSVKDWQLSAIADGFKFPKFGADGEWGSECEKVAKKAVVKKRITYKYKNLTKLLQKYLGIEVDGKCGSKTKEAIKAYQREAGLVVDGECGLNTWESILKV